MRLIDADVLLEELKKVNVFYYNAIDIVNNAPTIQLKEHDNDLIEKCAKVVLDEKMAVSYQSTRGYRNALIQSIRALKLETSLTSL